MSSVEPITDTPVSADRSTPSELVVDVNHNKWPNHALKRKLTYTPEPIENEGTSRPTFGEGSIEEKSSQSSSQERQTEASKKDGQSVVNECPSRPSYNPMRFSTLSNVCQGSKKSRQPVIVQDQITKKCKIRVIDYGSWQWQPILRLDKLTDDDLKSVDRSLLQSNPSHMNPIKFDKDEEVIRELSPDTAVKRFQKQMEDIKKLNVEPAQPAVESTKHGAAKALKRKARPEIDDLDKELRAIKRPKGTKGGKGARKLYHHERMFQNNAENIAPTRMHAKTDAVRNEERLGKRTPMRAAKNSNISYK